MVQSWGDWWWNGGRGTKGEEYGVLRETFEGFGSVYNVRMRLRQARGENERAREELEGVLGKMNRMKEISGEWLEGEI
ncbi:hypothetical protein MA16_Dca025190 [Dendrobium catenatum]|uniref:Uncharacterized protein n=1 Tax=Dendrobium catenatum TaxID=906689 RepID=A0A2I0VZ46_9ASPA|nr:hypothetical protein MA16_Dca025190 [Dendrobium catenatum]